MSDGDKIFEQKQEVFVAEMFDSISKRYDLVNTVLSLGIHKSWRKKAVKLLKAYNPKYILDVATGTGDFAIALTALNPIKVTGIDISDKMLEEGKVKIKRKKLENIIELTQASAMNMPYPGNTFDAISTAFGIRNFEKLTVGLKEIFRVLKPGSPLVIIEFSKPKNSIKGFYKWYFRKIAPNIGKMLTGNEFAYKYLPDTVYTFPERDELTEILADTGFTKCCYTEMTFGIACIYYAQKPFSKKLK